MVRAAIAGAAHPHVEYVVDELRRAPAEYRLVAVSDPVLATAQRWSQPFGAQAFVDHRAMLAQTQADVVVVAGVYGDRGRVVLDALNAGCDVVADKPLCTTIAELDEIQLACLATGKSVTLLLEKRFYSETLAVAKVLEEGELGRVVGITSSGPHKLNRSTRASWFFDRSRYGGILNDLGVHDIDAALHFIGIGNGPAADSGTVSGRTVATLADAPGFDLYGVATIATPAALVTIETSWLTPDASPVRGDYQMRIVGTDGVAELFWARHQLVVTSRTSPPREVALPAAHRPAELPLRALADHGKPDITTHAGLVATRVALLAQLSADHGGPSLPWTA